MAPITPAQQKLLDSAMQALNDSKELILVNPERAAQKAGEAKDELEKFAKDRQLQYMYASKEERRSWFANVK